MPLQRTGQVACHVQVRDIAMAACGQWYEALMGADNDIYKQWKTQNEGCNAKELEKRFINRFWPRLIEFARATMAIMLMRPDISEVMKEQIMDSLEKDQYLRRKLPNQIKPMHTVH